MPRVASMIILDHAWMHDCSSYSSSGDIPPISLVLGLSHYQACESVNVYALPPFTGMWTPLGPSLSLFLWPRNEAGQPTFLLCRVTKSSVWTHLLGEARTEACQTHSL